MIRDTAILQEQRAAWSTIRGRQSHISSVVLGISSYPGATLGLHRMRDLCDSLVLVSAYGVLEDILLQLRDEGVFLSCRSGLSSLMQASSKVLRWQAFDKVDRGRGRRNGIAHRSEVIPHAETWDYIDAIERELRAWGVVT